MKRIMGLMGASLLLAVSCYAQSVYRERMVDRYDVPDVVLKAFEAAYPKGWARGYATADQDGTVSYKIEFKEGPSHRYASYDKEGVLVKVEDLIVETDLPANARQSIQEKYPNATISFAEKITQGDRISYRANANKDDKLFTLQFDADGKLTSAHEVKVTNVFTRAPE